MYTNNFNKCNRLTKNIDFTGQKKTDSVLVLCALRYDTMPYHTDTGSVYDMLYLGVCVCVWMWLCALQGLILSPPLFFALYINDRFADWCLKKKMKRKAAHTEKKREAWEDRKRAATIATNAIALYENCKPRQNYTIQRKILFREQD